MLIPLGFLGGGSLAGFELISTQVLVATQNVTFSSIPQGYKHLQLRIAARDASAGSGGISTSLRLNNVSTSSYAWHQLLGNGGSATTSVSTSATSMNVGYVVANGGTPSAFGGFVIDILDYTNASTNKTVRSLGGLASGYQYVALHSGVLLSAGAVTQIDLFTSSGFTANSRFSLYGVRG